MNLTFGTDGVRGRAHEELTVAWVSKLARVAARVLGPDTFAIGADGRESGPAFVQALCGGFAAEGVKVWNLGVVPTPAVAYVAAQENIAGAMVSASHNGYQDNGIKFFAPGGRKLTDAMQAEIEALLVGAALVGSGKAAEPASERPDLIDGWAASLAASLQGRRLDGMSVVIDCAIGAASEIAPRVLRDLGCTVTAINNLPNGRNINADCGSTHPAQLREVVQLAGAAVGLAFDGDADRVLAVDADGQLVDGDHLIGIFAIDLHERGLLTDDTVVITVMTNLGFRIAMRERGIRVHETAVGDRYVLEALEEHGWALGGEQSGHVIFRNLATTGDGLLTGLQLLDALHRARRPLGALASEAMTRLPQVLENVRVVGDAAALLPALADEIAAVEADLGDSGRVLVRPSGTEPLLRVMVEAASGDAAQAAVDRLIAATHEILRREGAR
jgi:phosphoglucosamine mutase